MARANSASDSRAANSKRLFKKDQSQPRGWLADFFLGTRLKDKTAVWKMLNWCLLWDQIAVLLF